MSYFKKNILIIIFSYSFCFFFVSSFLFQGKRGFENFSTLLFIFLISILLTIPISIILSKISNYTKFKSNKQNKSSSKLNDLLSALFNHNIFCGLIIFFLHFPIFLAFYPGICYYDLSTQIEQFESGNFIENHPLLHTYLMGFFKNLFTNPNTGYGIISLIQILVISLSMSYGLKLLYKCTNNLIICTLVMLFYGLWPTYPLLTISTTKDILFAAFMFNYIIDMIYLLSNSSKINYYNFTSIQKYYLYAHFIFNAVLMLLFRNNAIYAFIPTVILILLIKYKNQVHTLRFLLIIILISYILISKMLTFAFHSNPGSIKEMMSIPAQEMARIYSVTDNSCDKNLILSYIENPNEYNYYLSDHIKQQLPFDILDSKCKHFLLDSCILTLKYPIPCIDAILYNTQGYWDLFHSPYQSDHFFLATDNYRGNATLNSKIPFIANIYIKSFYTTDKLQNHPILVIFFNSSIYIWIFLYSLIIFIHKKNRVMTICCLYPLFYFFTLCLGPGAIIRYSFPFLLLSPILLFLTLSE